MALDLAIQAHNGRDKTNLFLDKCLAAGDVGGQLAFDTFWQGLMAVAN